MIRKWMWLAAILMGFAMMAMACGGDSASDPAQQGDTGGKDDGKGDDGKGDDGNGDDGNGDDGNGDDGKGDDGDGDDGKGDDGDGDGDDGNGDDGHGDDGSGDDGSGGDDGDDGDVTDPPACEQLCDLARDSCGWLDEDGETYAQERAACVALCEAEPECVPPAITSCDMRALESCFISPDESEACAAMCDHVYYDCGASFGVSRADCGIACTEGIFEDATVECLGATSCEIEEMNACFADEEPEPDACEIACAHVIDECGNENWSSTSCLRACRATYTAEEKECLAAVACDADPIESCFAEFSCQAMCDHVYDECGSAIGDGEREDCEGLCYWGLFTDTEMTCFSSAACTDLAACDETVPGDADED